MGAAAIESRKRKTAREHHRAAFSCLSHQKGSCGGQLVGHCDLGRLQLAPEQVRNSSQVKQRRDAAYAKRRSHGAESPGASPAVVDHDADVDPGFLE